MKRRDLAKHLAEYHASVPIGTEASVAEICAFESEEYMGAPPSAGAITARLFPADRRRALAGFEEFQDCGKRKVRTVEPPEGVSPCEVAPGVRHRNILEVDEDEAPKPVVYEVTRGQAFYVRAMLGHGLHQTLTEVTNIHRVLAKFGFDIPGALRESLKGQAGYAQQLLAESVEAIRGLPDELRPMHLGKYEDIRPFGPLPEHHIMFDSDLTIDEIDAEIASLQRAKDLLEASKSDAELVAQFNSQTFDPSDAEGTPESGPDFHFELYELTGKRDGVWVEVQRRLHGGLEPDVQWIRWGTLAIEVRENPLDPDGDANTADV